MAKGTEAKTRGARAEQAASAKAIEQKPKGSKIVTVPAAVVDLLQAEIEAHNVAMTRWNEKIRAAATLSGIGPDTEYKLRINPDGSALFVVEDTGE